MTTQQISTTAPTLDVTVIAVLGPPGSGKGTQCSLLAEKYAAKHISIGDALRDEMKREGSPYAELLRDNMIAGRIGPRELSVGILKRIIEDDVQSGVDTFLLDGFPRAIEQYHYFEEQVAPIQRLVVLDCPDSILVDRLLARGRFDDTAQSIQKRIETNQVVTGKVIEVAESAQKLVHINAGQAVDTISTELQEAIGGLLRKRVQ